MNTALSFLNSRNGCHCISFQLRRKNGHRATTCIPNARTGRLSLRGSNGPFYFSSSLTRLSTTIEGLPYGLRRVDYTAASSASPVWSLPPAPPPHPSQSRISVLMQQYLPPFLISLVMGGMIYLTFYPDTSMYQYWQQVEQGNVPLDDDDDDDDDEEDDEEDE